MKEVVVSSASQQTTNPSPPPQPTSPTPMPSPSPAVGCSSSTGAAKYFLCDMYFNKDISSVGLSGTDQSYSNNIINNLNLRGGWGAGAFKIDFSIDVYYSNSSSSTFTVNTSDPNWYSPDSDLPSTIPASSGTVGFESSMGRTCDNGDCHYLVMDTPNNQLIEVYGAAVSGSNLGNNGYGSIAVWPFNKSWPSNYRGDVCTSADAGGLAMAPMLFTAEEIKAGAINHAIRFILPNNRIACKTYVRPATHGTGSSNCSGWAPANNGVPYGSRFRLKSTYDISGLSAEARVVATALKKYGMILADGGNIALTAKSDASTAVKYSSNFTSNSLGALKVTDFEVIPPESGGVIQFTNYDCTRTP